MAENIQLTGAERAAIFLLGVGEDAGGKRRVAVHSNHRLHADAAHFIQMIAQLMAQQVNVRVDRGLRIVCILRHSLALEDPSPVQAFTQIGIGQHVTAIAQRSRKAKACCEPSVFEQIAHGYSGKPAQTRLHSDFTAIRLVEIGAKGIVQLARDGFNGIVASVVDRSWQFERLPFCLPY